MSPRESPPSYRLLAGVAGLGLLIGLVFGSQLSGQPSGSVPVAASKCRPGAPGSVGHWAGSVDAFCDELVRSDPTKWRLCSRIRAFSAGDNAEALVAEVLHSVGELLASSGSPEDAVAGSPEDAASVGGASPTAVAGTGQSPPPTGSEGHSNMGGKAGGKAGGHEGGKAGGTVGAQDRATKERKDEKHSKANGGGHGKGGGGSEGAAAQCEALVKRSQRAPGHWQALYERAQAANFACPLAERTCLNVTAARNLGQVAAAAREGPVHARQLISITIRAYTCAGAEKQSGGDQFMLTWTQGTEEGHTLSAAVLDDHSDGTYSTSLYVPHAGNYTFALSHSFTCYQGFSRLSYKDERSDPVENPEANHTSRRLAGAAPVAERRRTLANEKGPPLPSLASIWLGEDRCPWQRGFGGTMRQDLNVVDTGPAVLGFLLVQPYQEAGGRREQFSRVHRLACMDPSRAARMGQLPLNDHGHWVVHRIFDVSQDDDRWQRNYHWHPTCCTMAATTDEGNHFRNDIPKKARLVTLGDSTIPMTLGPIVGQIFNERADHNRWLDTLSSAYADYTASDVAAVNSGLHFASLHAPMSLVCDISVLLTCQFAQHFPGKLNYIGITAIQDWVMKGHWRDDVTDPNFLWQDECVRGRFAAANFDLQQVCAPILSDLGLEDRLIAATPPPYLRGLFDPGFFNRSFDYGRRKVWFVGMHDVMLPRGKHYRQFDDAASDTCRDKIHDSGQVFFYQHKDYIWDSYYARAKAADE